jgi:two-component system sensor histidine kinase HydH
VHAAEDGHRVWKQELLDELSGYVGFSAEHAAVLGELGPHIAPALDSVVDRFYEAVLSNPRAAAVFTGGKAQIERQKVFLRGWLEELTCGVYDMAYVARRERIGRTHVRIRLDQRYMFGAMNIVRAGLHEGLDRSTYAPERRPLAHSAIDKICDIELAIMLQTYSEDYVGRMRDNERLATLGQLSGFIGHELRNPLAVMETSLHLLRKRLPVADEHTQRHMRRLSEQVQLSSGIISDLLELARDRQVERASVELAQVVRGGIEQVQNTEGVSVLTDIPATVARVSVDPKQLERVVVNLVTNACQAVASCTRREVRVSAAAEGSTLLLIVADTGPGVAEEMRHRLFEPLATTRPKGLGLGLALCRRIAEKHGGDIRAQNQPEGGAVFEVRFAQAIEGGAA